MVFEFVIDAGGADKSVSKRSRPPARMWLLQDPFSQEAKDGAIYPIRTGTGQGRSRGGSFAAEDRADLSRVGLCVATVDSGSGHHRVRVFAAGLGGQHGLRSRASFDRPR